MSTEIDLKLIFPVLKPGNWIGIKSGAVYEDLLKTEQETFLVKAYGYDLISEFRFLTGLDLAKLEADDVKRYAQKNIEDYKVEVHQIGQLNNNVLLIQDDSFASEKVFDVSFMKKLGEHFGTQELIASVPRRGLLLVAPERLPEDIYLSFVALVKNSFESDGNLAPISPLIITLESGQISGAFEP